MLKKGQNVTHRPAIAATKGQRKLKTCHCCRSSVKFTRFVKQLVVSEDSGLTVVEGNSVLDYSGKLSV